MNKNTYLRINVAYYEYGKACIYVKSVKFQFLIRTFPAQKENIFFFKCVVHDARVNNVTIIVSWVYCTI